MDASLSVRRPRFSKIVMSEYVSSCVAAVMRLPLRSAPRARTVTFPSCCVSTVRILSDSL